MKVSVIMPARDEEQDIGRAIESILAQQDVTLEIIVVNDHSTDRTGAIADAAAAADGRITVIHNPSLPPGWLGKCNAMQQAAEIATGDVLLFTDGDIVHQQSCMATALAELDRRDLDFLSLFPRMDSISLWENIVVPSFIGGVALLAPPGIEDPRSSEALGAGAFLMVRAAVFRAIGGFESIRGEMADDRALARLVKSKGYRVGLRFAPELLHVRLYKGNRHAFWAMTKNVLIAIEGRLWLAPAVMVLPMFAFWTPIYCAIAGIARVRFAFGHGRSSRLHHPLCFHVVRPPAFPVPSAQGAVLPARRDSGVLLHGTRPLPLSDARGSRVAWPIDPRARRASQVE